MGVRPRKLGDVVDVCTVRDESVEEQKIAERDSEYRV